MIILDIETTGVNPEKSGIIQIAAIDFMNPQNQFSLDVRVPESKEINNFALGYNGNTIEEIHSSNRVDLKEALLQLKEWMEQIENQTIAGHNPQFDTAFVNAACRELGIEWEIGRRMVDQHSLAYMHFLQEGKEILLKRASSDLHSDTIMKYVGIPPEPKPHKALNGAIYEAEAFSRLIYGKGLLEDFAEYEVPQYLLRKE